ncbi:LLM class flavin-dependent oxidoreductase [Streptomyces sp. NBC_00847]|uniref:LLM class flavin-dependent oxidoreductase n=1 Tax=unclassified Streptomyces TaxID=2593676 RepID=UPI002253EDC5|nr:LLM class flavin-dependent oxidoreductase [Streptomyces sp. NBC_00847]MCX4883835.1 LLM class flavin-dependent oxidoreductase [Streptomyces sp. NBC_00847]
MPVTVVRFNLVEPGATPASLGARYRAALEMAAYADDHGITTVQTEEHHGVDNNWLPSPFAFAGAVFGATQGNSAARSASLRGDGRATGGRITVTVSAAIGPLHDPLRLAEDIAVLDLLSGGRLVTVVGIGYRPEEYAQFDVDWKRRGRLQDELLETVLKAWTGEEFEYRGRTVRVTPRPCSDPHPLLLVGGSSKAAARRAARLGLPFFPSAHLPELEAYYKEKLTEYGTEGWTMMPTAETALLHIAEDPDRAWAEHGGHFLHEARTYASWQSGDVRSAVKSAATTMDELRAEGVYRILTPQECVAQGLDTFVLHPLAGGMPVDEGWRSLRLFCEDVLPRLGE